MNQAIYSSAKKIKLLICDVDGVLTDGGLYFDKDGNELKRFHSQDGQGLKALLHFGFEVAIISARSAKALQYRMQDLGISHYYQGTSDKKIVFKQLLKQLKLKPEQVAYIGDDVMDLTILSQVGLAIAVSNANEAIKPYVHWVTKKNGGFGAVREVCDFLLKAQGLTDDFIAQYLP